MDITKLVLPLLLLTITGCAVYGKVTTDTLEGQKKIFRDGRETIISQLKHTVTVSPPLDKINSGKRADFLIAVRNEGAKNILFSIHDIEVIDPRPKLGTKVNNLKVYSYEELVEDEKSRQYNAKVGAALEGISDSIRASRTGDSYSYGTYSSLYDSGTFSVTTSDSGSAKAAQAAAEAKSEARIARMKTEGGAKLDKLDRTILKKQTVFPGEWHGGIVKVLLPPIQDLPTEIFFEINVDEEKHAFRFLLEKFQQ